MTSNISKLIKSNQKYLSFGDVPGQVQQSPAILTVPLVRAGAQAQAERDGKTREANQRLQGIPKADQEEIEGLDMST